ncbi:MAG: DNA polymerase III subunit gamma/tau [Clostridia bacterium]|nr:DNA polymerase III subunit gamma/tau [Clostridia bacterium]
MQEYVSLYRRLRPTRFGDLVGQEHISTILKNALRLDRVSHAYLFCGPRGTGKTTTAKLLASAVNCHDPDGVEPCNQCSSCEQISRGYSMDVEEIDGASNRGIDEVRDLREKVKLTPAKEKNKVYIIDEVHMLTGEAFNALLKTLEEPPGRTIFILATTEPHKVPETILSRCQRFDFRRISQREIEEYLMEVVHAQGAEADPQSLSIIAKMAQGGLRDALSYLEQCMIFGDGKLEKDHVDIVLGKVSDQAIKDLIQSVKEGHVAQCLEIVGDAAARGKDIGHIFNDILEYLRGLLILSTTGDAVHLIPYGEDIIEVMNEQVEDFSTGSLFEMIHDLSQYEQKVKWSNQPQIILELAVIKMCQYVKKPQGASGDIASAGREAKAEPKVHGGHEKPPLAAAEQKMAVEEEGVTVGPEEKESPIILEKIRDEWQEIMVQVRNRKISLHAVLLEGKPRELDGKVLTIVFPSKFKFHKETVEDGKNRKLLESILSQHFKHAMKVKCVLEGNPGVEKLTGGNEGEQDPLVRGALEIFGGEIIDIKRD